MYISICCVSESIHRIIIYDIVYSSDFLNNIGYFLTVAEYAKYAGNILKGAL
jgi:hypothetical protein